MVVQYNFDFTDVVLQDDDAGLLQLIKGELKSFFVKYASLQCK